MRNAFLPLIAVFCWLLGLSPLRAEPGVEAVVGAAGGFFKSLPDCNISYTVALEFPNVKDGGRTLERLETTRNFCHQGGSWRQEIHDSEGRLQRLICFDGQTFYDLNMKAEQLNITSDVSKLPSTFSTELSVCPLFYCHALFFCPLKYEFSPSRLLLPTEWQRALAKWDDIQVDTEGRKLRLTNNTYQLTWEPAAGGVFPASVTVKNPGFNNATAQTTLSMGEIVSREGLAPLQVPMQIKSETFFADGKKVAGMDMRITKEKSFLGRKTTGGMEPGDFRIPLTAAKLVWDADVGAYIKK